MLKKYIFMGSDSPTKSLFGLRIRDYRKKRGWTQTQAARIMGVQRTSLNRWEHGHEMPSGENVAKLRDHLNLPIGFQEKDPLRSEDGYQLLLPLDPPIELLIRIGPKIDNSVQVEVQFRQLAS